jgi:hypothetical protein
MQRVKKFLFFSTAQNFTFGQRLSVKKAEFVQVRCQAVKGQMFGLLDTCKQSPETMRCREAFLTCLNKNWHTQCLHSSAYIFLLLHIACLAVGPPPPPFSILPFFLSLLAPRYIQYFATFATLFTCLSFISNLSLVVDSKDVGDQLLVSSVNR